MKIDYVGGASRPSFSKRDLNRRIERFLDTQPIYETKTMLIDIVNMFQRKFMCNRENCDFYVKREGRQKTLFNSERRVLYCDRGCCEGGSLEITKDVETNIDKHIKGIYEYMDPVCKTFVENKGWKQESKNSCSVRSLPTDLRCIFTIVDDNDMSLCALHRYALMNDYPIMDFKPFECAMFPMDVLKVDDKYLLTAISEIGDTRNFLRWGNEHCVQSCLRNTHDGIPFYEYCKDTIIELFGEKRYDLIDKIYHTKRWKRQLKEKGRY